MTLELRFWGTRGSIPSPGPQTVRYGGNTPCVEVRDRNGHLAILDAGTGIRALGNALLAGGATSVSADVYVTHAHWDHIQGLPFFAPLFHPGHSVRIWTAPELGDRIERALRAQMSPEVFPVPFEEMLAQVEFRALPGSAAAGEMCVTTHPVRHPGGALGYRLAGGNGWGGAVVYIPDNELDPAAAYAAPPDWRARLVDFLHGADVLVHDAMYTAEEAAAHRGWGHSSALAAVELALEAGVRRLVLFHHHPERSDDEVDALLDVCRARAGRAGGALEVLAAAEGQQLIV
ncbi:MAG TPA: MBL fold metallo-hydrolase [Gemmatimonadales bacterium]